MGGKSLLAVLTVLGALAQAPFAAAAEPCKLLQLAELPVTMESLSPVVDAKINGEPVRLIVDSGAFFSMLDETQAAKFKLRSNSTSGDRLVLQGVNGEIEAGIKVARVFTILGHDFTDVDFVTAPETFDWSASGYLGQNFINVTNTEYDLANGMIRLFKVEGCENTALAYWAAGKPFSMLAIDSNKAGEREIRGKVSVNGVELSAVFDTGAERSVLSLRAAAKAGVKRDGPDVQPGGLAGGVGRKWRQSWIAPVQSFKIGDEEIRNTRLRIGEIDLDDSDMLVGADFFLSHRIFVDNNHRRLYLTYNGGPVFRLDVADKGPASGAAAAGTDQPAAAVASDAEPKDADGFVRRAHASDARHDYARAIADYTRAVALDPKNERTYYARAESYVRNGQPDLAIADFDQALKAKPDDLDALIARGAVHLDVHRPELARTDFEAAAKLDPTKRPDIAGIYTDHDQYPEAVAVLDAWLAELPKGENGADGFNGRCWARALWNHELDKALADCNQALRLAPGTFGYLDSRGLTNLRLGRYDDAVRDYDAALRQQPKFAWTLYCRGIAKKKAGRATEGDADMKAAIAIDPEAATQAKRYGLVD